MPHHLDAMLAKCWFILAPTSSSSVKSASSDLRSSAFSLGSAVVAVTSSRNSVLSSSEGEILNSSSSHLHLLDASSLSSESELALERSLRLWRCFFCGFASWRASIVCNKEAIVPIFTLISARVLPGWLDKPASAG